MSVCVCVCVRDVCVMCACVCLFVCVYVFVRARVFVCTVPRRFNIARTHDFLEHTKCILLEDFDQF